MTEEVRVRFAPSPTGYLHIGGVRSAIFNHLFARHNNGTFILRIEDTDRERSTKEALDQILDSLAWLDLDLDEGPFLQSDRSQLYRQHLDKLLEQGKIYRCYCKPEDLEQKRNAAIAAKQTYKYDKTCRSLPADEDPAGRPFTLRFKTPEVVLDHFDDLILGQLPIDEELLDDWIVARTDGGPTYNFCVVVDDADMKISHVIRGNDHVSNTPKQILLYQAFGYEVPAFAHLPLTHGPDGSKLSKRKEEKYKEQGISVSALEYKRMGYLPHALFNYLARLGWSHGDQEIFSREEFEKLFDLKDVGKSAGVINPEKLKWLNAHYIKSLPDEDLVEKLTPFLKWKGIENVEPDKLSKICGTLKERVKTFEEMADASMFYFKPPQAYDPKAVKKWWKGKAAEVLTRIKSMAADCDLQDEPAVEEAFRVLADEVTDGKLGKVAQPLRVALTGTSSSPSLFTIMSILGREEILQRIDLALLELERKSERAQQ